MLHSGIGYGSIPTVQLNLVKADLEAVTKLSTIFSQKQLPKLEKLLVEENISHILCI
jgi:hypothetical protein